MRVRLFVFPVAFALLLSIPSRAQVSDPYPPSVDPFGQGDAPQDRVDWSDDVPAHVAVVDGTALLERDGRASAAEENTPLLAGDRLRTERGRVEVLFADGSALDIDEYSSIDLLSDALMRLMAGRVRLSIARATGNTEYEYRIDTAAASARIRTPGEYRLTLSSTRSAEPELDLVVLRGVAELANEHGRTLVRAGTRALATARLAPSLPYATNSAAWDAFDRWVENERDARLGVESGRYLPADLRYYGGAFDRYGSWDYAAPYGYVWYPRVSVGWRPYHHGRWSFSAFFGWTWVGFDRWSWATHHYGRWGLTNDRWYWIPDRRWAPAWVSWASAPGYVSWCPLGYDGRPVIAIGSVSVRHHNPWLGWTVLPARTFVPNVVVARAGVPHQSLPPTLWSQFATRPNSPRIPMANLPRTAMPRAQPVRSPGSRAGYAMPQTRPVPTAPLPSISSDPSGPTRAGVPRGGTRPEAPSWRPDSRPSTSPAPTPSERQTQPGWSPSRENRTSPPTLSTPSASPRSRVVPRVSVPNSNDSPRNDSPRSVRPAPESRPAPPDVPRARPRSEDVPPPSSSDRGGPGMRSRPPAGADAQPAPASRPPSRSSDPGGTSRSQPEHSRAVPRGVAPPPPSSSRPPSSAGSTPPTRDPQSRTAPPSSRGGGQAVKRRGGG